MEMMIHMVGRLGIIYHPRPSRTLAPSIGGRAKEDTGLGPLGGRRHKTCTVTILQSAPAFNATASDATIPTAVRRATSTVPLIPVEIDTVRHIQTANMWIDRQGETTINIAPISDGDWLTGGPPVPTGLVIVPGTMGMDSEQGGTLGRGASQ